MTQELNFFLDIPPINTQSMEELLNQDRSFQISIIHPTLPPEEQFAQDQFDRLSPDLQVAINPCIKFIQLPIVEYHDQSGALLDLPPRELELAIDHIDQAARQRIDQADWPAFDQVIRHNKFRVNELQAVLWAISFLPPELELQQGADNLLAQIPDYKSKTRTEKDAIVSSVHHLAVSTLTQLKNLN